MVLGNRESTYLSHVYLHSATIFLALRRSAYKEENRFQESHLGSFNPSRSAVFLDTIGSDPSSGHAAFSTH